MVQRNLCVLGCPLASVYKGGEEDAGQPLGRAQERSPTRTPSPSRIPLGGRGEEGRRGRGRGKEGPRPPPLFLFGLPLGGRAPPLGFCPLSPLRPTKAHYFPGGFR